MTTSPDDRWPLTGYLVWRLSLKWRAAVDRVVAPLGLTHAQYALLASLYGLTRTGARPSQRQLADVSGLEPMYVSKLVRALERAGLLARATNAADPRAVALDLTERGNEVVVAAMAEVRTLQERLLAPLGAPGDERRRQLSEALRTLLRHADDLDRETPAAPTPEAGRRDAGNS